MEKCAKAGAHKPQCGVPDPSLPDKGPRVHATEKNRQGKRSISQSVGCQAHHFQTHRNQRTASKGSRILEPWCGLPSPTLPDTGTEGIHQGKKIAKANGTKAKVWGAKPITPKHTATKELSKRWVSNPSPTVAIRIPAQAYQCMPVHADACKCMQVCVSMHANARRHTPGSVPPHSRSQ